MAGARGPALCEPLRGKSRPAPPGGGCVHTRAHTCARTALHPGRSPGLPALTQAPPTGPPGGKGAGVVRLTFVSLTLCLFCVCVFDESFREVQLTRPKLTVSMCHGTVSMVSRVVQPSKHPSPQPDTRCCTHCSAPPPSPRQPRAPFCLPGRAVPDLSLRQKPTAWGLSLSKMFSRFTLWWLGHCLFLLMVE